MERRPHLLLEATLLAMGFAEATEGFVYLRDEYARSRERLARALGEFGRAGLLEGRSIELVIGAGAYICGEETAMLESMEGRRGMPRLRPPFPAQSGDLGRPTLINNVETLAHVPFILREGGEAWAALGRRGAPGVRLWSLTGAVRHPGCYEAPNGITARELIDEHGGGATAEIGAIVPGGAASGILSTAALDTPLTRDALRDWGRAWARPASRCFRRRTRSGACSRRRSASSPRSRAASARRAGSATARFTTCSTSWSEGRVAMPRWQVEEWLDAMLETSICGLGQGAPLPVRGAFRYWPDLFAALGEQPATGTLA